MGYYNDKIGLDTCAACPENTTTLALNSTAASDCYRELIHWNLTYTSNNSMSVQIFVVIIRFIIYEIGRQGGEKFWTRH